MAWQRAGGEQQDRQLPPIIKWNKVGEVIEGIYKTPREGKFGPLLVVETNTGEVVYGMKTALRARLDRVPVGSRVKITYLGKRRGKSGKEYHDFDVLYDAGAEQARAGITGSYVDHLEFDRLVGLIRAEKGNQIADALKVVAQAQGDPVKALRDSMAQIGVVSF